MHMFRRNFKNFIFIFSTIFVGEAIAQSSELKNNENKYKFAVMGKNKCADPDKAMPLFNELLDYQKSQLNNDFTGFCGVYDSGEAGCIVLHPSRESYDAIQEWQANSDKWMETAKRVWNICEIDDFAFTIEKIQKN